MVEDSAAAPAIDTPHVEPHIEETDRANIARSTIKYYAGWSFGAGLVSIPVVDMLLVMGVQVQMLRKMSDIYGVNFSEHIARNLIAALLGGLVPETLSRSVITPFLQAVPIVGPILGLVTMPAFSAASTYAVGQVFLQHFESGGTFLDFNPEKVRDYFRKEFTAAKAANGAPA
jgi:uncharacterized protein (DUF697 family)